jgi:hypothetical protein
MFMFLGVGGGRAASTILFRILTPSIMGLQERNQYALYLIHIKHHACTYNFCNLYCNQDLRATLVYSTLP